MVPPIHGNTPEFSNNSRDPMAPARKPRKEPMESKLHGGCSTVSERKFGSPRWPRSVANAPVEDGSFGFIGYPNFSEFNLRRCQRMMSELSQSFLSSFFDHACGVTKVGPERSRAVKIWKKCFPQLGLHGPVVTRKSRMNHA